MKKLNDIFKNSQSGNKISLGAILTWAILMAIALWATFALYVWIGSYDIRFYNVTKYARYLLLILSIIFTISSFYLIIKYIRLKLKNN